LQTAIGYLVLGQFAIHVLVERHHPGDHLFNSCGFAAATRTTGTTRAAFIALGTLGAFPALTAIGRLSTRERHCKHEPADKE
jgi:hypothetical protein